MEQVGEGTAVTATDMVAGTDSNFMVWRYLSNIETAVVLKVLNEGDKGEIGAYSYLKDIDTVHTSFVLSKVLALTYLVRAK